MRGKVATRRALCRRGHEPPKKLPIPAESLAQVKNFQKPRARDHERPRAASRARNAAQSLSRPLRYRASRTTPLPPPRLPFKSRPRDLVVPHPGGADPLRRSARERFGPGRQDGQALMTAKTRTSSRAHGGGGVQDLEEEHAFPVRPGGDARAGVALAHRAVAPRPRRAPREGLQRAEADLGDAHLGERTEPPDDCGGSGTSRGPARATDRKLDAHCRPIARARRLISRARLASLPRVPASPGAEPERENTPRQIRAGLPPRRAVAIRGFRFSVFGFSRTLARASALEPPFVRADGT